MTREEFFDSLAAGAKWDVGVSIARTNPLPLDSNSVFESYTALTTYAGSNPLAYPGQIVAVLGTGEDPIAAYLINTVGAGAVITKLASSTPSGDVTKDIINLQNAVANIVNGTTVVGEATKATQDGNGKVISDTYATKEALSQVEGDVANAEANIEELQTGLAGVKTTADNAMPKAGGDFTGAVTVLAPTADTNPATKKYVDDAIGGITGFDYQVVESLDQLPETGEKGIIYLVPDAHGAQDAYDEYIWVGDKYEKIGNTDVNLDGYVKGTGLTADKIVLGSGDSNVKASTYGVATAVTAADEANLPTNKAVADYVATAKSEAITAAGTAADEKIAASKTDILGDVDKKLADYVTNTALDEKGYITKEVADLVNYTTTTDLNTALSKKADQTTVDALPTEDKVKSLIAAGTAAEAGKVSNALTFGGKTFDGSVAEEITAADLGALTSVPLATSEAIGGFKTGYADAGNKVGVQIDADTQTAFVEVPAALVYGVLADGGLEKTGNDFGIKASGVVDSMIANVNVNKLVQTEGDELILDGGKA